MGAAALHAREGRRGQWHGVSSKRHGSNKMPRGGKGGKKLQNRGTVGWLLTCRAGRQVWVGCWAAQGVRSHAPTSVRRRRRLWRRKVTGAAPAAELSSLGEARRR
eukprot:365096-Chlamydomonas_euryale.AAC.4